MLWGWEGNCRPGGLTARDWNQLWGPMSVYWVWVLYLFYLFLPFRTIVINRMSSLWMIWLFNNGIILFVWMTLFYWPLNNALFCCAGSKSVKNIRKRQQAKKTDIYTRMKNSVFPPSTSTDNLAVEEYTVGDTVQKCQNNIQRVITVINKTKKKLIEYHCMLAVSYTHLTLPTNREV